MPSLSERLTIPSPPDVVWPLLADPAIVAACLPGATLTAPGEEPGTYIGTLRVKLGPAGALFRGAATLTYDEAARRCTIDAEAVDGSGTSQAVATGIVTAAGDRTTVLTIEGSFSVAGPLAAAVDAGGVAIARALLAEFSQNLTRLIVDEGVPAPEAAAIPMVEPETATALARAAVPSPAADGSDARRGLFGWLGRLFGRRARA